MKIIPQMLQSVKDIPAKHYCGRFAWLDKRSGETSVFFCGSPLCGRVYCQKLYYLKRIRVISDLIGEHDLDRFVTLTMGHSLPKSQAWGEMPHVWNKARTMLTRRYKLRYCFVLEAHADGYPHLHGFVSCFIDQREWSKTFASCGGGSYAWIEKIKVEGGNVGSYVSKQLNVARYVGKDQVITARQMMKPRARTFWRSQGMKTEYERKQKAGKSICILVAEDFYKQTENGFDKLMEVVYSEGMGCYLVSRNTEGRVYHGST